MTYAAILAGGTGVRMGNPDKPKQFFMLGEKPILIHTLEKFCSSNLFSKVVVLTPKVWVRQTCDLVERYCPEYRDVVEIIAGGATRNDTIMNAIHYIEENYEVTDETILVTHDAVRPFVSYRIIKENIEAAKKYGACDTVVPATDTIVVSSEGEYIDDIPSRSQQYQGQTPQSFLLNKLKNLAISLNEEENSILTDACKIFVLRGEKVFLVRGEEANIKITYPHDLRVAEALIGGAKNA